MHIDDAPSLQHELPHQAVRDALVDVADVHRRFFILLPANELVMCQLASGRGAYQCLAPDILTALVRLWAEELPVEVSWEARAVVSCGVLEKSSLT